MNMDVLCILGTWQVITDQHSGGTNDENTSSVGKIYNCFIRFDSNVWFPIKMHFHYIKVKQKQ